MSDSKLMDTQELWEEKQRKSFGNNKNISTREVEP